MQGLTGSSRHAFYISIVVAGMLLAATHKLRFDGIFACMADGYSSDQYLAYCQADSYGEYDHGAFWFGLEPVAQRSARDAQVLFLGNSQLQHGFSTTATADWFAAAAVPYYLLGFDFNERHVFAGRLLERIQPDPRAYIINLAYFFESLETGPAQYVMHSRRAHVNVRVKNWWQVLHRSLCTAMPAACGREYTIFRSRSTGAWSIMGGGTVPGPVAFDGEVDQRVVEQFTVSGREFLQRLSVDPQCVIFTVVPSGNTQHATADAIANALDIALIMPKLDGLRTLEGVHLDQESAERWSTAFFHAAGPRLRQCLGQPMIAQS